MSICSKKPGPVPASETKQPNANQKTTQYCPAASELKKNRLWWSARGAWKSYSQSFAKGISSFLGAQWIGIKVGKIVCLYSGQSNFDFPIALETEKTFLILSPKGKHWYNIKSGYKMCKSSNTHDCEFFLKPPPDITNVYEQIKYDSSPGKQNDTDDEDFMYNH